MAVMVAWPVEVARGWLTCLLWDRGGAFSGILASSATPHTAIIRCSYTTTHTTRTGQLALQIEQLASFTVGAGGATMQGNPCIVRVDQNLVPPGLFEECMG